MKKIQNFQIFGKKKKNIGIRLCIFIVPLLKIKIIKYFIEKKGITKSLLCEFIVLTKS